jgi:hypothetical protein
MSPTHDLSTEESRQQFIEYVLRTENFPKNLQKADTKLFVITVNLTTPSLLYGLAEYPSVESFTQKTGKKEAAKHAQQFENTFTHGWTVVLLYPPNGFEVVHSG